MPESFCSAMSILWQRSISWIVTGLGSVCFGLAATTIGKTITSNGTSKRTSLGEKGSVKSYKFWQQLPFPHFWFISQATQHSINTNNNQTDPHPPRNNKNLKMNTAFVNATPIAVRTNSAVAVTSFMKKNAVAPVRPAAAVVRMSAEPQRPKIPQGFTAFSEQLNGRVAMMGLLLGLVTEVITGRGMVGQLSSIFEIWSMASTLGN